MIGTASLAPAFRKTSTAYRVPLQNVTDVVDGSNVLDTTLPFRMNRYPSAPGRRLQANVIFLGVLAVRRSRNETRGAGTSTSRPARDRCSFPPATYADARLSVTVCLLGVTRSASTA